MVPTEASAPSRIDLAGGTLDIWPLYLLHPGSVTVNVAISLRAEARVRPRERGVLVVSRDRGISQEADRAEELQRPELRLLADLIRQLAPEVPLELDVSSAVPLGSGLGGSSALAVASAAALATATGRDLQGEELVRLVQDVETGVLGVLTGRQDYASAVWGGLAALWWKPGGEHRRALPLGHLESHLVLMDTAEAHFSGANNWEIARARLDGDEAVAARLEGVAAAARDLAEALEADDLERAGLALAREWERRKRLTPRVSTPRLDRLVQAAHKAGAWGAKVCGAGGGGALVALGPSALRETVAASLEAAGARRLHARPDPQGLLVTREPSTSAS